MISRLMRFTGLLLTVLVLQAPAGTVMGEEKITIGEAEDVILLPWGVRMPARIDTGASLSSLDAQDLVVIDNTAEFRLHKRYGGLKLRLPVLNWQHVRSSEVREKRPIVEIEICLGPRRVRTKVSLNDRSMVTYPLIIGRDVLKRNFIVDCTRSNCSPPTCPEASP